MKCISCGAIVTSDQKVCPCCGAKNPEYERKALKMRSLEREHEQAKEQSERSFRTIWQDKLCNIFLIAAMVLSAGIIGAMIAGNTLGEEIKVLKPSINKGEYISKMEEYYTKGDYDLLYKYMTDEELFGKEEYYKYSQAANITHYMDDFRVTAYPYIAYARGDRSDIESDTSAGSVVSTAHFVVDWRFTEGEKVYLERTEMNPENVEMYDQYVNEIKYIFTTYFGLTEDEYEDCFIGDGFYSGTYENIIKERTGYFEY